MNFLNLIIFCVLLVTVTAQTTKFPLEIQMIFNQNALPFNEKSFENFENLLLEIQGINQAEASSSNDASSSNVASRSKTLFHSEDPFIRARRFNMEHLKNTPNNFKKVCQEEFEKKMKENQLNCDLEKREESKKIAFQVLEIIVEKSIQFIQEQVRKHDDLLYLATWIWEHGDGLHFLSYYNHLNIPKGDLDNEVKKLMKSEHFNEHEAHWAVILFKFNGGKIKVDYPEPSFSVRKVLSKLCLTSE